MLRACLLSLLMLLGCFPAHAQNDDDANLPTFTLKVYANLAQVPTLVLDSRARPVTGLPRSAFAISIDDGPIFAPTQMRTEGDDPISLTVLLDASSNENKRLLDRFAAAFAALAPNYLHPTDTVSVYALDCTLIRTALFVPVSQIHLEQPVSVALNDPRLHNGASHPTCSSHVALWDAVALSGTPLARSSARRVLLILSSGHDGGSIITAPKAGLNAGHAGAAVFALRETFHTPDDFHPRVFDATASSPDALETLCTNNGGHVFSIIPSELASTLRKLLLMVRSRYIIEFPRPDDTSGGVHNLTVTVPKHHYEVHSAGVTMPLLDPARANDPNVVHSAPSPAKVGTHRPEIPQ